jgi:hypothetical protein
MKRHLLLLFLFAASVLSPLSAQQRTESEALAIAKAFMENNGYSFNATQKAKTRSVTTSSSTKITPITYSTTQRKVGLWLLEVAKEFPTFLPTQPKAVWM